MYLILDPSVVYSVSSKVDVYVEWASGYLRHTTDGKWSSITPSTPAEAAGDGMYVSPAFTGVPPRKFT